MRHITSDREQQEAEFSEQEANRGSAGLQTGGSHEQFESGDQLLGSITATPATSKLVRARTKMSAMKST